MRWQRTAGAAQGQIGHSICFDCFANLFHSGVVSLNCRDEVLPEEYRTIRASQGTKVPRLSSGTVRGRPRCKLSVSPVWWRARQADIITRQAGLKDPQYCVRRCQFAHHGR
jgi:hypothetical protein